MFLLWKCVCVCTCLQLQNALPRFHFIPCWLLALWGHQFQIWGWEVFEHVEPIDPQEQCELVRLLYGSNIFSFIICVPHKIGYNQHLHWPVERSKFSDIYNNVLCCFVLDGHNFVHYVGFHLVTSTLSMIWMDFWRESFGMLLLDIYVHFNSFLFQMEYEYQTRRDGNSDQFVWQRCNVKRERSNRRGNGHSWLQISGHVGNSQLDWATIIKIRNKNLEKVIAIAKKLFFFTVSKKLMHFRRSLLVVY